MRVASIVARILFGLAFTAAGGIGLYIAFTSGPPPMPGSRSTRAPNGRLRAPIRGRGCGCASR